MVRVFRRVVVGFSVVAGAVLMTGVPPAGSAPSTVIGPCQASGTFEKGGITVDANETGVVTIPAEDTVNWTGSITGANGDVAYTGKIQLELPPPLPKINLYTWSGTTDSAQNSSDKHYDVGFAPRGVEMKAVGSHNQGDVSCGGVVKIKLKGGAFDSPGTAVSLVGTLITGAVFVMAGIAKKGATA
jgi:hypothetical protein